MDNSDILQLICQHLENYSINALHLTTKATHIALNQLTYCGYKPFTKHFDIRQIDNYIKSPNIMLRVSDVDDLDEYYNILLTNNLNKRIIAICRVFNKDLTLYTCRYPNIKHIIMMELTKAFNVESFYKLAEMDIIVDQLTVNNFNIALEVSCKAFQNVTTLTIRNNINNDYIKYFPNIAILNSSSIFNNIGVNVGTFYNYQILKNKTINAIDVRIFIDTIKNFNVSELAHINEIHIINDMPLDDVAHILDLSKFVNLTFLDLSLLNLVKIVLHPNAKLDHLRITYITIAEDFYYTKPLKLLNVIGSISKFHFNYVHSFKIINYSNNNDLSHLLYDNVKHISILTLSLSMKFILFKPNIYISDHIIIDKIIFSSIDLHSTKIFANEKIKMFTYIIFYTFVKKINHLFSKCKYSVLDISILYRYIPVLENITNMYIAKIKYIKGSNNSYMPIDKLKKIINNQITNGKAKYYITEVN